MGEVVRTINAPSRSVFNSIGLGGITNPIFDSTANMLGKATGEDFFSPSGYAIDRAAFDPNQAEQDYVKALQARMAGQTPSAAEMQMRAGQQQAAAQAQGMAASQRGISPGLAARLAAQAQAQGAQDVAQKSAVLRAQEQQQSEGLLGNMLSNQRQSRMAREQLASGQNIDLERIKSGAFESSANRAGQTLSAAGQAMAGMASGGKVKKDMSRGQQAVYNAFGQFGAPQQNPNQMDSFASAIASMISKSINPPVQEQAPVNSLSIKPEFAEGGVVSGMPTVPGDHEANDFVPAKLSPGEIVVPRSVSQMSPQSIAAFVKALQGM